MRAEITARRPCRVLAPCRHRLISPHSPHDTFVCPPWGPVLWLSLRPPWHRRAWAGCPTLSSPWDSAVLPRASHGRGRKDSRLSHLAGDTQVTHPVLASCITAQRPRALGRPLQGLSASLSGSQQDLLRLAPIQPVPGMALLLLHSSRSNGPYLLEPVSLLSGAVHLQIPF